MAKRPTARSLSKAISRGGSGTAALPAGYATLLANLKVWKNCASHAKSQCRLVIRFGAINNRKVDALELAKESLRDSPWKVLTSRRAGTASTGNRQADHFVPAKAAIEEYDIWAALDE